MKKTALLFASAFLIAGGLFVSCDKKNCMPRKEMCAPKKMEQNGRQKNGKCAPCNPNRCKNY